MGLRSIDRIQDYSPDACAAGIARAVRSGLLGASVTGGSWKLVLFGFRGRRIARWVLLCPNPSRLLQQR
jgi:hypothetical protein